MGLSSNIMSLGGIAIAVGAMVDAAIVVVEQTHKKLEQWERTGRKEDYHRVVIDAVKEVGGPSFFALLVIAVSFLPVLTLEAQEGRLFKPLAYTKNFSMIVAAVLAITLDPAMRLLFTHMKDYSFRPALAGAHRQRGAGRHDPFGGHASDQPRPDPRSTSRSARGRCAGSGWCSPARSRSSPLTVPGLRAARLGVHAAARRGHAALHAVDAARHLRRAKRSGCSRRRTASSSSSPKSTRVLGKAGRAETSTDPGAVLDDGDRHRR